MKKENEDVRKQLEEQHFPGAHTWLDNGRPPLNLIDTEHHHQQQTMNPRLQSPLASSLCNKP
ncbi:hypothetical protein BVC80_1601g46 [Macleaya cordata]|uniref:Uncharacterized protein n=1 Tax=Macleaya cordata TaxID=56857 RepID=A0A200QA03_MACCD|nr:hypothetical protein BVC80_1601g46 [Macleaya cordata]